MKIRFLFILLAAGLSIGCQAEIPPTVPPASSLTFATSDAALQQSFDWAQRMALSYAHNGADPVGPWYEAALPQREAFCMRDVSHQAIGAQVLGLTEHNRNMMQRFAQNITPEKDWCSYWEINRYNLPAPADYANDREFWYNLNANFDVLQACLKLYEWTGDATYLNDPELTNFYQLSMNQYLAHWLLQPDSIMARPQYMHSPQPFDPNKSFHTCRGLASYVENFRGLTLGVDLLATLYAGHMAYSRILSLKGDPTAATAYSQEAQRYRHLLETRWWNPDEQTYHTFWTANNEFHSGEGEPFILWFGATNRPERIRGTMSSILNKEWNVENRSAFPALFYRLGYPKEAYAELIALPRVKRAEYPEVSYGVIEGVAGGVMGIQPEASAKRIITLPALPTQEAWAELKNIPVFGQTISLRHDGNSKSELTNNTGADITWRASFRGRYNAIAVNGKNHPATVRTDEVGNEISYIDVALKQGEKLMAEASSAPK